MKKKVPNLRRGGAAEFSSTSSIRLSDENDSRRQNEEQEFEPFQNGEIAGNELRWKENNFTYANVSKEIGDYSVPVDKAAGLLSVPLLDDDELVEGRRRRRGSHPLVKRPRVGCEVMDRSSMAMADISKQQSSSARG